MQNLNVNLKLNPNPSAQPQALPPLFTITLNGKNPKPYANLISPPLILTLIFNLNSISLYTVAYK